MSYINNNGTAGDASDDYLWTKYFDETANEPRDYPTAAINTSTYTMVKYYKIGLNAITDPTIKSSIKSLGLKVTVENKDESSTPVTTRARLAVAGDPANTATTGVSHLPDATSASYTPLSASNDYNGSAIVLAYVAVRVDGSNNPGTGETKDTGNILADFTVTIDKA